MPSAQITKFTLNLPQNLTKAADQALSWCQNKSWSESRGRQIFCIYIKGNYLAMKNCIQCGYRLAPHSNKFYCCNKQQPVCSTCHYNPCKKCKQRRLNIIEPPKCLICSGKIYDEKAFCDPTCGKYFCSKCLASTFNKEYKKFIARNCNGIQNSQLSIKLPCKDDCKFNVLVGYFKDFCVQCGRDYSSTLDFDLKDGLKLCFRCESYFKDSYVNAFIKCNICADRIQNKSKAGIANDQDLILCRKCFQQSNMEEKYIEKTKELNESRKRSSSVFTGSSVKSNQSKMFEQPKKKPEPKIDIFYSEKKSQSLFQQRKFQQTYSQKKTQRVFQDERKDQNVSEKQEKPVSPKQIEQKVSMQEKPQKSEQNMQPLTNVVQKTQPSESKVHKIEENTQESKIEQEVKHFETKNPEQKKQQNKEQEVSKKNQIQKRKQGSSQYFVTNNLTNQEEEADEEITKRLGVEKRIPLRKHLSDETYVENLRLQIVPNKLDTVDCNTCNIKISSKLAYNLDAKVQQKPSSSSLLIISRTEETSMSASRSYNSKFLCRVCYSKQIQPKKSVMDKSMSTNDHSYLTKTSQKYEVSETRKTTTTASDLRGSTITRRQQTRSPPKPIQTKPYGLNGATKPSSIFSNLPTTTNPPSPYRDQPLRTSTPLKPTHQKLKSSLYKPQRRATNDVYLAKCIHCGLGGEALYHSLDGGKYCKECYMRKNRHVFAESSFLKNIY